MLGKVPDKSPKDISGSFSCNDFIVIKVDSGEQKVLIGDVLFIESCGNYLKINCADHRYVVRETLAGFLQKLPPELFLRVHRSFVVAISKVGKVTANAVMIGDHVIPIGNLYKAAIRDSF